MYFLFLIKNAVVNEAFYTEMEMPNHFWGVSIRPCHLLHGSSHRGHKLLRFTTYGFIFKEQNTLPFSMKLELKVDSF
jgi:hypothetical protein